MMWTPLVIGLSWTIQALYIHWFFCFAGCCWFQSSSAEAKCQVKTDHGAEVILHMGPFPEGIYYDQTEDRFLCESPGACQGYSITGCEHVRCEKDFACLEAHFRHIHYLGCHGYNSCPNVTVIDTEMMHCGPLQTKPPTTTTTTTDEHHHRRISSCEGAKIQINDQVNCMGPGSCYAEWWENRMVVHVGANATVSCGSSTETLEACGNLEIQVSHGNRACYEKDPLQTCALYCDDKKLDCSIPSIQFRVEGS